MPAATEAQSTGKVEQWGEFIAIIESDSCPYTSMLKKLKKPGGVEFNWQVKSYPQAGFQGVLDNKPAVDFNSNPRTKIQCVAQKSWWNPAISDFADEQELHGTDSEWADQVHDSLVTVKRVIEKKCLSNTDVTRQADTNAQIPNTTRGAFQYFATSQTNATYAIDPAFRTPAGSIHAGTLGALTERVFLAKCRNAYKQRKGPHHLDLFCGIDLKAIFTDFANYTEQVAGKNSTRLFNQEMASKELVNTVDRLVLDSGTVDLHPSSFLWCNEADGSDSDYTHRSGFGCDMDMAGIGFTRMPRVFPLAADGSGKKAIVDTIFIHIQENPLGAIAVQASAD